MNFKQLSKRILSYFIDLFLITIVASCINAMPFLNPNLQEYDEVVESNYNLLSSYNKTFLTFKEAYSDKEITEEEYNDSISDNKFFAGLITESYDDKTITQEEYDKIMEVAKNDYQEESKKINYLVQKYMVLYYVIYIILVILYFGIFPIFTKGQTIGKKLTHLRVVTKDYEDASYVNYIVRSVLLYNLVFYVLDIALVIFIKEESFYQANYILTIIQDCVQYLIFLSIFFIKDNRGLHDIIANTKVVEIDKNNEIIKSDVKEEEKDLSIKEAKVLEKKPKSKKQK